MPLYDHFRPPLSIRRPWEGFHSAWANTVARQLNRDLLPPHFFALPHVQFGNQVETDVATVHEGGAEGTGTEGVTTVVWAPPRPGLTLTVDFTQVDVIEVQIFHEENGLRLLAAIEFVSPANKDRPSHCRAFAVKCGSYLQQAVSLVVVDVVTERCANMHAELVQLLEPGSNGTVWHSPTNLFAAAYRTLAEQESTRLEVWPEPLALGAVLPRLPLWLGSDLAIPLDLEESYLETCASLRITG